jgi:hypothetical protein
MVGIEAVWINQCSSILPQVVTNLLYITVCIITKSEQSNILVSHMEPRLVLRVYYMYSITVHIMQGGGGGASVGSDMNSPLPPLLGFWGKHLSKVYI